MPLKNDPNQPQKPSGFQPKSNGANEPQGMKADSFGDGANIAASQLQESAQVTTDQLYATGYLGQMQELAVYEQGRQDCLTDYLGQTRPDDPFRAQAQDAMQAPRRAMLEALTQGVIDESGVNVRVGKPRSLAAGLQSLTQQTKQLSAGK